MLWCLHTKGHFTHEIALEESLSISTSLATRPSQLAPKKCINKSIWLATGGGHLPWVHHGYLPGANQIDLFMHFPTHESRWPRLKWTSFLLVLRACDHYTSSSLIGGKGGAGPSSLHTRIEGPTE